MESSRPVRKDYLKMRCVNYTLILYQRKDKKDMKQNQNLTQEEKRQEEKKALFNKLWNIQDSLKCNTVMLKSSIKTIEQINNYDQEAIYTFYSQILREAEKTGTDPEQNFNYKIYEETDINNQIIARYCTDLYKYLKELEGLIQELEGVTNEI